jgi:hypothetical protein
MGEYRTVEAFDDPQKLLSEVNALKANGGIRRPMRDEPAMERVKRALGRVRVQPHGLARHHVPGTGNLEAFRHPDVVAPSELVRFSRQSVPVAHRLYLGKI